MRTDSLFWRVSGIIGTSKKKGGFQMSQSEMEALIIDRIGRTGASAPEDLFMENILNMILLFPAGVLLPIVWDRKMRWWKGLLFGIACSAGIEVLQLVLCRGLFEFDDMIHNGVGCMLGSVIGDWILRVMKK